MKGYLKRILTRYGLSMGILLALYLSIWAWAILTTEGPLRIQLIFGCLIVTLVITMPPVYILFDSYKRRKDAGAFFVLSFFLSYFGVVLYLVKRKNLDDIAND